MSNKLHLFRKPFINVVIFAAMLLSLFGTPHAVSANTIRVDVLGDAFGDGTGCSLREAIYAANNDIAFDGCGSGAGEDTIVLDPGTYVLSIGVTDYTADAIDQDGMVGDLDIWEPLRIVGAGESQTIIRPIDGAKTRIFHISAIGINVSIQNLTLTNGYAYADIPYPQNPPYEALGGAIFNRYGRLTLERTTVTGNTASHSGGGIYSDRESSNFLFIQESTIRDNTAKMGDGGGIASESSMLVMRSLVWKNTAEGGNGGGIYNNFTGRLAQVTVAENRVLSLNGRGSGVYNDYDIEVLNSTIVHNVSAARERYGIELSAGQGVIFNNIIAYNKAKEGDTYYAANCWFNLSVVGAYNYREENELGSDGKPICTGQSGSAAAFFVTDPGINLATALDYNLGRTMNYALQPGSSVIDKGQPENLFIHPYDIKKTYHCTGRDQRGAILPNDGDKNGTRICDPGAVEFYPDGAVIMEQVYLPMLRR